jgi:hypothetical protein
VQDLAPADLTSMRVLLDTLSICFATCAQSRWFRLVVVPTYLEQYLAEMADIKHRLKSLSTGDFDILEVKQLISIAGLRTEHFLRAAVVPSTSFKDDFAGVINALKSHRISKELRQDLHQLRKLYNDVKHNPEFRPSISDALQRLSEAESFASGLHGTSIGKVHFPISRRFHRILWVAGWDHMASQSADLGGDRNQDRPLRSPVPSVRGEANRHPSTRVFGSHVVLDDGRSRKQTARFQDLLQPPSHAYLTGRANAGSARVTTHRQSPLISLATSLPILISDTGGCLIFQRLALAAVSGQPRQDFQEIIRCFSIGACFAGPVVSLRLGASPK